MTEKTVKVSQDIIDMPPQELGSAAVAPEAIDVVTRAERERVLALVRRVVRDCPLGPHAVTSALQTLTQDIENGERAP